MAAVKYGKLTVSTAAQEIGDDSPRAQEFIFQAPSANTGAVYIAFNGDTAVADQGFNLEPGEDVTSEDVPMFARQGPFSIIGTASDVFYYTFSKARGV